MIRTSLYVFIASLFVFSPGCGSSKTPVLPEKESKTNETTNAAEDSQTESAVLKRAMIDVSAELMKKQQPNIDPDEVRKKVEYAITQIRQDVPDFLMVSADDENRLQTGEQIEGVHKRISDATAYLTDTGSQLTGLVTSLLPQHKAGTLSPARTELLAQLVVAEAKKKQAALTK